MFKHVGIVGGGHMGADVFGLISASVPVTLWVRREEARDALEAKLLGPLRRRAKRDNKKGEEARARLAGLKITCDMQDLAECDLITESIVEDPDIKRDLLGKLSEVLSPTAVVTTNSSYTIPSELAPSYAHPERFAGMHFFYPSKFVPFVELIPHPGTDEAVMTALTAFVESLKKRVLLVTKELPGFLVNRAIGSYYTEGLHIVGEGQFKASHIDRIAKERLGMIGPVEASDQIGLDVILMGELRFPHEKRTGDYISPILRWAVEQERRGVKAGRGVYLYENGKAVDDPNLPSLSGPDGAPGPYSEEDVLDRLYYGEIQEAYRCVDLGVGSREDVEYCLNEILGFKEGPIAFTERIGKTAVLARLKELEEAFGPRFKARGSLAEL